MSWPGAAAGVESADGAGVAAGAGDPAAGAVVAAAGVLFSTGGFRLTGFGALVGSIVGVSTAVAVAVVFAVVSATGWAGTDMEAAVSSRADSSELLVQLAPKMPATNKPIIWVKRAFRMDISPA